MSSTVRTDGNGRKAFEAPRASRGGALLSLSLSLLLVTGSATAAEPTFRGGAAKDPARVVGPEKCGECHKSELATWGLTHHAQTFQEMHRKPRAQEIVGKLGGSRIKVNPYCLTCHYTEGMRDGKSVAMWGVTCESCHGAARDWVDVHNSYGPKGTTKETETAAHRTERLAKSAAAGMIRPQELYRAVSNCFQCHTVPDEELVNVGGHKPRSEFELVAWSQGEIRHNFKNSADAKNRPATAAHKRVLFVTGIALDLEYSLRAAARATKAGPYLDSASQAIAGARKRLQAVQAVTPLPAVAAMLKATDDLVAKAGDSAPLLRAAESVGTAAKGFVAEHDGNALASLDKLLPAASTYRGTPQS